MESSSPLFLTKGGLRQLMSLNSPKVLLRRMCRLIKKEQVSYLSLSPTVSSYDDMTNSSPRNNVQSPSSCVLCSSIEKDLSVFSSSTVDPRRDNHLRLLLGMGTTTNDIGDLMMIFCTVCRQAVTKLFNLMEEGKEMESRIRSVVKLCRGKGAVVPQGIRQLLSLDYPKVMLGPRCPSIKEEMPHIPLPIQQCQSHTIVSLRFQCSLCTQGSSDEEHLWILSSPAELSRLGSLLGTSSEEDLTFCTLCRSAVTRMFNLWEEVEDIECRIRTVVKLRGQITETIPPDDCSPPTLREKKTKTKKRKKVVATKKKACPICNKTFISTEILNAHTHLEDSSLVVYTCNICQKHLGTPDSLTYHRKTVHLTQFRRVCSSCGKVFKRKDGFQRHSKICGLSSEELRKCSYCGQLFPTRGERFEHERVVHKGKEACKKCYFCSKTKWSLDTHMRIHTRETPFACVQCGREFNCSGNLKNHRKVCVGSDETEMEEIRRIRRAKYRRNKVRLQTRLTCRHCGKALASEESFQRHRRICFVPEEQQKKCDVCARVFSTVSEKRDHERVVHQGNSSIKCYFCLKTSSSKAALDTHLRLHTRERPYICHKCGSDFADTGAWRKHRFADACGGVPHRRGWVRPPRYECPRCQVVFSTPTQYRSHMTTEHKCDPTATLPRISSVKRRGGRSCYRCPECWNKFNQKQVVYSHLSRLHGLNVSRTEKKWCPICKKDFVSHDLFHSHTHPDKEDPSKVVYPCHLCQKVFASGCGLRGHKKHVHEQEPRSKSKCYFCSKIVTSRSTDLTNHLRIHTLERPFRCEKCGKDFKAGGHLRNHMARVCGSDEKQREKVRRRQAEWDRRRWAKLLHRCDICHKRFGRKRNLVQHQQREH